MVGPDLKQDASLCPVRSLKLYIKGTKARRGNISQLFITNNLKGPARPAHVNTISSWVKSVVAHAYSVEENSNGPLLHRATHEIRAQAASYALYANVSIEQILKTCRWAQHSTFTHFYLREISGQQNGLLVLPPLMAAGTVVNTRRATIKGRGRKESERSSPTATR